MTFVLPDSRLEASRQAQLAYAQMTVSAARMAASSRWLISCLVPAALIALWWIASRLNWLPGQVLPGPAAVLRTFADLWSSGELPRNLARTLGWLLAGSAIGAAFGMLLGAILGLSRRAEELFYPALKATAYVPLLGWLPLWLMLLGPGNALKLVLVAQASLIPLVVHVLGGIKGVPAALLEMGQVLRLSRGQLLRRIILPAAFPSIWRGVRVGLTKGWQALIAIEVVVGTAGLGHMIMDAHNLYRLDLMLVAVMSVGIVGCALDRTLAIVERRALRLT